MRKPKHREVQSRAPHHTARSSRSNLNHPPALRSTGRVPVPRQCRSSTTGFPAAGVTPWAVKVGWPATTSEVKGALGKGALGKGARKDQLEQARPGADPLVPLRGRRARTWGSGGDAGLCFRGKKAGFGWAQRPQPLAGLHSFLQASLETVVGSFPYSIRYSFLAG